MQFAKEINHLFIGLLFGFLIIAGVAGYWAITGEQSILDREDNARLIEAEERLLRGGIYDRQDVALVESIPDNGDIVTRQYHYPAMHSALGYYSLQYGVGGAESAFDEVLRGDNLDDTLDRYFQQEVLHHPQEGSDIQLTLDSTLQQTIVDAIGDTTGAVVVMAVPSGEVLGMVSQPTFDPNNLDETWDSLVEDETRPFFNRALQGNYQSGGVLYLASIATALSNGYDINQPIDNATQDVVLDALTLTCTTSPEADTLTLAEAFVAGCPYPLTLMVDDIGLGQVEASFDRFSFTPETHLQDFVTLPEDNGEVEITPEVDAQNEFTLADVLGQGEITITPLHMVMITSAIINEGNAPIPIIQLAQRPRNGDLWEEIPHIPQSLPLMTSENATIIRDLTAQDSENGISGGYSAIAFSGDQTLTWYIGFATSSDNTGFAVAVLLEDTNDIAYAQTIGERALSEAINRVD